MFPATGAVAVSATPFVMTLLFALGVCALVLAIAMLFDSERESGLVRAAQRLRLTGMRLPRMLRRHGVEAGDYLAAHSVTEIREHIRKCEKCAETLGDLCDRDLDAHHPCAHTAFAYCPNRNAVQRYLVRKRSA